MKQLANVLITDYDDPQLTIGLLAKLSRKFSERNVLTKMKSLLVLHRLMHLIHSKAQVAVSKSFASLQLEIDEKNGNRFFNIDSVSQCRASADDASTVDAIELCREYAQYVFDYIRLRDPNSNFKGSKRASIETETKRAKDIVALYHKGEKIEASCRKVSSLLGKQCMGFIKQDKVWIVSELKRLYNVSMLCIGCLLVI